MPVIIFSETGAWPCHVTPNFQCPGGGSVSLTLRKTGPEKKPAQAEQSRPRADIGVRRPMAFIRSPGTLVPKALCFTRDVFFLSPRDLRTPSADRRETLPHDRNVGVLYSASPKIRGSLPPPKKLGAKNMQNSARFQTTSDFDREYLRNGSRYLKSERHDHQRFLPRSTKKVQ